MNDIFVHGGGDPDLTWDATRAPELQRNFASCV